MLTIALTIGVLAFAAPEPAGLVAPGAALEKLWGEGTLTEGGALAGDGSILFSDIGDRINTQVVQPLIDANPKLARNDFPDFNDPVKLGDGDERRDKLTNLIAVFENPALDFSGNRAEHDDITQRLDAVQLGQHRCHHPVGHP